MKPTPLLVAGDPGQYTGGYIYDARIAQEATRIGHPIEPIGLPGHFPVPDTTASDALEAMLESHPAGHTVIIDGLVLGGLPEVAIRHAGRLRLIALVHHPLAEEFGIDDALAKHLAGTERQALSSMTHVVVTSQFTACRLTDAYDVSPHKISVIEPGLDKPPIPRLQPAMASRLLCVASLIPRKGHAVLVDALARIRDLDWQCDCVGDTRRDPECTQSVRDLIQFNGLAGRMRLTGARPPEAIRAAYNRAGLFVLPSYYEGYGMVIVEALAHGLPVVTTNGGALAHTLPPEAGIAVPPGDSQALADKLRLLLTNAASYARLTRGARHCAAALPEWKESGRQWAHLLEEVAS